TSAGVDALIVQDLGLARLIRAISPDIEIHASTQMSITSEEGVELARELGCTRVILARELSLAEIGRIRRATELPLEVFVPGALSPGDRRGLVRPADRVHPPRRPGDAALLLARVLPRVPRRQQPQGPGPRRLRQEARDSPGRRGSGHRLGRPNDCECAGQAWG